MMKLKVIALALGFGVFSLTSCNNKVGKNVSLNNELDSVSYALGSAFGSNVVRNGIEDLNRKAFLAAMESALNKDSLLIQPQEAGRIISNYTHKVRAAMANENKEEGTKFLEENKTKEGVTTLESGLQYKILKEGDGPKPAATDKVKVHYHGTLIDGTVFDSSKERGKPAEFPVNRVIKGWTEALQLMPVGSTWQLFIPSDLAYGVRGAGGDIGPNSTLVFEVELLEILSKEEKKEEKK